MFSSTRLVSSRALSTVTRMTSASRVMSTMRHARAFSTQAPQQLQQEQQQQQQQQQQRSASNKPMMFGVIGATSLALLLKFAVAEEKKESAAAPAAPAAPDAGLSPKEFRPFKLLEIQPLNHNTSVFRFALSNPDAELEMPVASFVLVQAIIDGKEVVRPYTPIAASTVGVFDLLVKKYETGPVSSYIHNLKVGDTLSVKGPIPKIQYKTNMKKRIGMIAGGTGITPMLQVIHKVLADPEDKTELTLLFANISEKDILLREWIDVLAAFHPGLKVHYIIDADKASQEWKGLTGYVSEDMVSKLLPPPGDDNMIFVCGPPGMMQHVSGPKAKDYTQGELDGLLKKLGYTKDMVFKF